MERAETQMWSRISDAQFSTGRSAACSVSTTRPPRKPSTSRDLFNAGLGPYGSPLTPQGFRAVFDFLGVQGEKRKCNRGEDLISLLLSAQEAGAPLNDQEIVANMTVVLLAGNADRPLLHQPDPRLWRNPDQRKRLCLDPSRWRTPRSRRACDGTPRPSVSPGKPLLTSRYRTTKFRPTRASSYSTDRRTAMNA